MSFALSSEMFRRAEDRSGDISLPKFQPEFPEPWRASAASSCHASLH
jgi:hypothetical protein